MTTCTIGYCDGTGHMGPGQDMCNACLCLGVFCGRRTPNGADFCGHCEANGWAHHERCTNRGTCDERLCRELREAEEERDERIEGAPRCVACANIVVKAEGDYCGGC